MNKTLGIRFVYKGATAQIAFSFRGLAIQKMPSSAMRALELPRSGLLESFGCALMGLLFWHDLTLSAGSL